MNWGSDYVDDMVLFGTYLGFASETSLTIAWYHLDDEIRKNVRRPEENIDEFRGNVEAWLDEWTRRLTKAKRTTHWPKQPMRSGSANWKFW